MLVLGAYLLSVVHLEDKGGVPYHPTAFGLHAVILHFFWREKHFKRLLH